MRAEEVYVEVGGLNWTRRQVSCVRVGVERGRVRALRDRVGPVVAAEFDDLQVGP